MTDKLREEIATAIDLHDGMWRSPHFFSLHDRILTILEREIARARADALEAAARVADGNALTGTPDGLTEGEVLAARTVHRLTKLEIAAAIRALARQAP